MTLRWSYNGPRADSSGIRYSQRGVESRPSEMSANSDNVRAALGQSVRDQVWDNGLALSGVIKVVKGTLEGGKL